ncbi:CHRD domain-containing protein, partial [Ferruginibacter sp.]
KVTALTDDLYASLKTDAIYVNAHSTSKPGGLIRGQIR